jgi:dUTPase
MSPCAELYLSSSDLTYTSNDDEVVQFYNVYCPDDIVVPANSVVNINMKIRIAAYCPAMDKRVYGVSALPTENILLTPLMHAIGCTSLSSEGATDLYVPVRNVSDSDYTITTGDNLFRLVFMQYQPMKVYIVDPDHIMME